MVEISKEAKVKAYNVTYGDKEDRTDEWKAAFCKTSSSLHKLAEYIQKYEAETLVDPYLKRAREILAEEYAGCTGISDLKDNFIKGTYDNNPYMKAVVRALKEGMPSNRNAP